MVSFIPHFTKQSTPTIEPPKKKKKKTVKNKPTFSAIFNSHVYSYIGSSIALGKGKELCDDISDAIVFSGKCKLKTTTAIKQAVALLQLSQDATAMALDTTETKLPAVGYWIDQLINYEEGTFSCSRNLKMKTELHQMSIKLLNRLVSHTTPDEDEDEDGEDDNVAMMLSAHVGVEFSLPEAIIIVLYAFVPLPTMKRLKFEQGFRRIGLALTEIFVPIYRNNPILKWQSARETFELPTVNFTKYNSCRIKN